MLRHLEWLRLHAGKVERRLRHDLLTRLRPPRWLPCFLFRLWYRLQAAWVRVPVIVELEADDPEVARVFRARRARLRHRLELVNCWAADLPVADLSRLCACPGVRRMWRDTTVRVLQPRRRPNRKKEKEAPVRAQLDVARVALGMEAVHRAGWTGAGVNIGIVDTGLYPHQDLEGRLVAFKDLVKGRRRPYDDNGHGTHVAGCAAGSGAASQGLYTGTAPGAGIVAVKALDRSGSGRLSTLIAGIQWLVEHARGLNVRVISLSLGGTPSGSYRDDPLARAVAGAWAAGLVVVAAAGNEGPEPGTISSPGIHPQVLTVGAMDDRNTAGRTDDRLADFSSRGPTRDGLHKPDLLAPGVDVVSCRAPGSYLDKVQPAARVGRAYFRLSGTSMATPLVAGVAAALLQRRPELTPDQVKAILLGACEDRGLSPDEQGAGYLDARRAILGE